MKLLVTIFCLCTLSYSEATWYNRYIGNQYPVPEDFGGPVRCPVPPPKPRNRDTCTWEEIKNDRGCTIRWKCMREDKPRPCPEKPAKPEGAPNCKWISIRDIRGCIVDYECEPVTEAPCPRRQPKRPPPSERCRWTAIKDAKGCTVDFQCEPVIRPPRVVAQPRPTLPLALPPPIRTIPLALPPPIRTLPLPRPLPLPAPRPLPSYRLPYFRSFPQRGSLQANFNPIAAPPRNFFRRRQPFPRSFSNGGFGRAWNRPRPSFSQARFGGFRRPAVPRQNYGELFGQIIEEPFVPEPPITLRSNPALQGLPFPIRRDSATEGGNAKLLNIDQSTDVFDPDTALEKEFEDQEEKRRPAFSRARQCVDRNEECTFWESEGECESNPVFMLRNCRKSCNACDLPPINLRRRNRVCKDRNDQCDFWAFKGECEANAVYMRRNCRKSCNLCDLQPGKRRRH